MQRIDHTCSSALNFINSNSRLSINLKIKWSLLKKITIYTIWRLIFRTKNPRIYEIINLGNSINWINRQERKKKKPPSKVVHASCVYHSKTRTCRGRHGGRVESSMAWLTNVLERYGDRTCWSQRSVIQVLQIAR